MRTRTLNQPASAVIVAESLLNESTTFNYIVDAARRIHSLEGDLKELPMKSIQELIVPFSLIGKEHARNLSDHFTCVVSFHQEKTIEVHGKNVWVLIDGTGCYEHTIAYSSQRDLDEIQEKSVKDITPSEQSVIDFLEGPYSLAIDTRKDIQNALTQLKAALERIQALIRRLEAKKNK